MQFFLQCSLLLRTHLLFLNGALEERMINLKNNHYDYIIFNCRYQRLPLSTERSEKLLSTTLFM